MQTETEIIVTSTGENEGAVIVDGEVINETASEVIEAVSDNQVTIAAIEADKEVSIAEINADARVAEAEAYREAQQSTAQGNEELWTAINHLTQTTETLAAAVAPLILAQSQPSLVEAETLETVEQIAETLEIDNSIQQSTSEETKSTPTEATDENETVSLIPPLVEVEKGPVIRLV